MLSIPGTSPTEPDARPDATPNADEKRGRRWLVWSFVFCPCHLPLTMGVLATLFGGTAFGALVDRNTLTVGIISGTIYAIGVGIGFRHLRRATAGIDCANGQCELPTAEAHHQQ